MPIIIEEEKPVEYKYYFNLYENAPMTIKEKSGTNDHDLFLLSEIVNDPMTSKDWEKVDEVNNIQIYRKMMEGSDVMLSKTISTVNYDKETILKAITDINIRKNWDKVLKEYYLVESKPDCEIIYAKLHGVSLLVSERELVQQRKIWRDFPDSDSICVHYISTEHPQIEHKKSIVRAEIIIAGYFLKTISVNPPRTLVVTLDQFDYKGKVPKFIINKFSTIVPKEWISNLNNACKQIELDTHGL